MKSPSVENKKYPNSDLAASGTKAATIYIWKFRVSMFLHFFSTFKKIKELIINLSINCSNLKSWQNFRPKMKAMMVRSFWEISFQFSVYSVLEIPL